MYQSKKFISILLALVFVLSGCEKKEVAPKLAEQKDNSYIEYEAEKRDIDDIIYCPGYVSTEHYKQFFKKSGVLDMFYVSYGDKVKKGDLIGKLECTDAEKKLEVLRENKERQRRMSQNGIKQDTVQISLKKREINTLEEEKKSEETIALARMELEEFEETLRYDSLKEKAEQEGFNNQIARMEKDIKDNYLYATASGTVSFLIDAEQTSSVAAYQTAVVLSDEQKTFVEPTENVFANSVMEYKRLFANINGEIYDLSFRKVPKMIEKKEEQCAEFLFKQAPKGVIGFRAMVGMVRKSVKDAVVIPEQALNKDTKGYYVYESDKGSKKKVPVTIGINYNGMIQIKEGLEEGQKVIGYAGLTLTGKTQESEVAYGPYEEKIRLSNFGNSGRVKKAMKNNDEDVNFVKFCFATGEGKTVHKGDALYVIRYQKENLDALSIQNEEVKLKTDYEKQRKDLQESLRGLNLNDPSSSLKKQLFNLQMEQMENQYEISLADCKQRYDAIMSKSGERTITSPVDGYVWDSDGVKPGDKLKVGQKVLTIYDYTAQDICMAGDNMGGMQFGARIQAVSEKKKYELHIVKSLHDVAENSTDNAADAEDVYWGQLVIARCDSEKDLLRTDQTISAMYCWLCKVKKGIVIGTKYLFEDDVKNGEKYYVWVKKDGYLEKRYVMLGGKEETNVWIIDGLAAGETIVAQKEG